MSWIDRQLSATHLFLLGLLVVPTFLLQPAILPKAAQTVLFVLLCAAAGRRFNLVPSTVLFAGILVFHLLTPAGRVLLRTGPLVVTDLALREGLFRALTVTGLFYISRFAVRRDITLPGTVGRLLSRVFTYYELLLRTASLRPERFMESLDEGLLAANRAQAAAHGAGPPPDGDFPCAESAPAARKTAPGHVMLAGLLALSWSLLAVRRLPGVG